MARALAVLSSFFLLMPASRAAEKHCGFTNGAVLTERIAPGIAMMNVKREWRGMEDEFWVTREASATYPWFTQEAFAAASAVNAEVRAHVETNLALVGCPEDAQLPSRRSKLVDANSHLGVFCQPNHVSDAVVSISCSASGLLLYSPRPSANFEELVFALDGHAARRLDADRMFGGDAVRKRLLSFVREELKKQGALDDPNAFDSEEDLNDSLAYRLQRPKLTAGSIAFDFASHRSHDCVELPRSEWEWALTPDFFDRMTKYPSKMPEPPAGCQD